MKISEIRTPLLKMLEQTLIPIGFEKRKTNEGYEYINNTNHGFIGVTPFINQYDKLFFISLSFQIRLNAVSEILVHINNISNEYKETYPTLSFGINSLIKSEDNRIKVETPEDLQEALNLLKKVLENEALRILNQIKSIDDLDKEMNRENRPKDLYTNNAHMIGLIAAVLNKNPNWQYWENYYREKIQNSNQHVKNQYEKLVVFLNQSQS